MDHLIEQVRTGQQGAVCRIVDHIFGDRLASSVTFNHSQGDARHLAGLRALSDPLPVELEAVVPQGLVFSDVVQKGRLMVQQGKLVALADPFWLLCIRVASALVEWRWSKFKIVFALFESYPKLLFERSLTLQTLMLLMVPLMFGVVRLGRMLSSFRRRLRWGQQNFRVLQNANFAPAIVDGQSLFHYNP